MIQVAVCDDDLEELNKISSLLELYRLQKQSYLNIHCFTNGFSLLDAIEHGGCFDILILDIVMPGENGMDIAREIRKDHTEIEIIFLTSSPEYAVESYEIKANNYILKPTGKERFFSVMENCLNCIEHKRDAGLMLRTGANQYTRILYSKLVYGEAMRKSVNLYLSDNTVVSSVMTFTELVNLLQNNHDFVRTHRSYIVNMHFVEHLNKQEIIMMNGTRLPIPKKKYPEVSKRFFDFAFTNSFGEGENK